MINAYRILVGKHREKIPFGRQGVNVKIMLEYI
jgi:hypothetical protein